MHRAIYILNLFLVAKNKLQFFPHLFLLFVVANKGEKFYETIVTLLILQFILAFQNIDTILVEINTSPTKTSRFNFGVAKIKKFLLKLTLPTEASIYFLCCQN